MALVQMNSVPQSDEASERSRPAVHPAPVSSVMLEDEHDVRLASRVLVPVLITAAARDRRDICARVIHAISHCGAGPFVAFVADANAAAGNGNDAHVASNRTDDIVLRQHFDHARGGTLFVDDIAALTPLAQLQLLVLLNERVLRHFSIVPQDRSSVRIIAGASRRLDTELAAGTFCQPLFYRLNGVHVDFTNRQF